MNQTRDIVAIILPHFSSPQNPGLENLRKTITSITNQSDNRWKLIIVDDASTLHEAIEYLQNLQAQFSESISIIYNDCNSGPGYCRNLGIHWAHKNKYPISMFIDSDDICHIDRVKVTRRIFSENKMASVVYSTFRVIDEHDLVVPEEKLSPSIREILASHKNTPPQGKNAWIDIGTKMGYTNLTSATSVKTEIAFKYPFPPERVSEDAHTWFRYSAGGQDFVYTDEIPTLYRIPSDTAGSTSRTREGGKHSFYKKMSEVDESGFREAIDLAIKNKKITNSQIHDLLIGYYLKQCETMILENEIEIALDQFNSAARISEERAIQLLEHYDCSNIVKSLLARKGMRFGPQNHIAESGVA